MVDLLTISETERVGMEGGSRTTSAVDADVDVYWRSVDMGLSGAFRGGAGGASPLKDSSEDSAAAAGVVGSCCFLPFLFLSFRDLEEERVLRLSSLLLSAADASAADMLAAAVEPDPPEEVVVTESEEARAGAFRLGIGLGVSSS